MKAPSPVFKQNGNIDWMGTRLGIWSVEELGGRDESGNRLVPRFWHVYTIAGRHFFGYRKSECLAYLYRSMHDILVAARTLSEEQQQLNINNAR